MKHLKLYENFNRYDYGKYTNHHKIDDIFNSFQVRSDEFDEYGIFDENDIKIIDGSFSKFPGSFYRINKPKNTITFQIFKKYYLVYALGDYCYAFFEEDATRDHEWTYCEIVDGIDDLCVIIENFINTNNSINESLSRYDYGKYTDQNSIDEFYDLVHDTKNQFSENESEVLYNLLEGCVEMLDINQDSGFVLFEYNKLMYHIQNLGDYCFVIFVDKGISYGGWVSCEILDDFDNLCIAVQKIYTK